MTPYTNFVFKKCSIFPGMLISLSFTITELRYLNWCSRVVLGCICLDRPEVQRTLQPLKQAPGPCAWSWNT